ncbi:type II secretion system F family protein [Candidatus Gracilibacteria bacterium]|nr:type II secretion system F family protein [Candidatus Gracilibacteria bacterium]
MKKAQDFILDSKLGDSSFQVSSSSSAQDPETISLAIDEGALPISMLKEVQRKMKQAPTGINLYRRVDAWIQSRGKPKANEMATFFRLFSIMINAGVPLIKSLDTIAEQTGNYKLKNALFDIARSIEKGSTFSESMVGFDDLFSDSQRGMIRAAEASGQLNSILKELALEVEKTAYIKAKVKGALMYPAFVITVMIAVVIAMMVMVIPGISQIFLDTGKELPMLTQYVIAVSDFFVNDYVYLILGIITLGLTTAIASKTAEGIRFFDWAILRLPIFGSIVQKSILARFCRTLGNLLRSGVAITKSLAINGKSLGNVIYQQRIALVTEDLEKGIPLGESLRDSPEFPPMMVQMISVGEQTAQLDTIVMKIAEYYEDEIDTAVASISKLLEPLIIVVLGGIVGVIVAAIMMPILQLSNIVT